MRVELEVEPKVEPKLDLVVDVTRATRDAHRLKGSRGREMSGPETGCSKYNVGKIRLPSLGIFLCIEGEEAIPCQLPGLGTG
jgi:hypothetical protein